MYGMILGAAKSWNVATQTGEPLDNAVNFHLYRSEKGMEYLRRLSCLQEQLQWIPFTFQYHADRFGEQNDPMERVVFSGSLPQFQKDYVALAADLKADTTLDSEIRDEMLLAAEGVCVMAELYALRQGEKITRVSETKSWLTSYRTKWTQKNKESELHNIEDLFLWCEENWK
jgi:hypothetical protein